MTEKQGGRRAIEVGPTGRTVAENLTRLRAQRGFTTRQLAGALERVGRPVSASGISRMEKGERSVTADELVALSVVLGVNTNALLFPPRSADKEVVTVTGAENVSARRVWQWAERKLPLIPLTEDPDDALADFHYHSSPAGMRRISRRGERAPEELERRRTTVIRLAALLHPDAPEQQAAFIAAERRRDPEPWDRWDESDD